MVPQSTARYDPGASWEQCWAWPSLRPQNKMHSGECAGVASGNLVRSLASHVVAQALLGVASNPNANQMPLQGQTKFPLQGPGRCPLMPSGLAQQKGSFTLAAPVPSSKLLLLLPRVSGRDKLSGQGQLWRDPSKTHSLSQKKCLASGGVLKIP